LPDLSLIRFLTYTKNTHITNERSSTNIFNKTLFLSLKRLVNFKAAITEMYPWIPWGLVKNPLGSAQHALGATGLADSSAIHTCIIGKGMSPVQYRAQ